MSAAEWVALIGAGAAVLSLVYAALGYHRPPVPPMPGEVKSTKRRFSFVACIFALVACGSVGFDYYDRHATVSNGKTLTALAYQTALAANQNEIAALKQQLLILKTKLAMKAKPVAREPTAKACEDARIEEDLNKRLRDHSG